MKFQNVREAESNIREQLEDLSNTFNDVNNAHHSLWVGVKQNLHLYYDLERLKKCASYVIDEAQKIIETCDSTLELYGTTKWEPLGHYQYECQTCKSITSVGGAMPKYCSNCGKIIIKEWLNDWL